MQVQVTTLSYRHRKTGQDGREGEDGRVDVK